MRNLNRGIITVATISLVVLLPKPGSAQSLSEAIRGALERSPEVAQQIAQARSSIAVIDEARSSRKPQVGVEAATGPAYRDRSVDGLSTGSGDTLFSRKASLSVQQLLLDWGQSGRYVESAELRSGFERLLVAEAREDQGLQIAENYIDLIRYRLLGQVYGQRLAFLEKQRVRATEREQAEGSTDEIILRGRIASAKADRIEYRRLESAIRKRLAHLTEIEFADVSFPPLPGEVVAGGNATNSAQYKAALMAIQASEKTTEALRKGNMPKVFLEARGGLGEDYLGIDGPDNDVSALLVFRWNPYEGGRKRAVIEQALAKEQKDRAAAQEVLDAITDQVTVAREELGGAIERYNELHNSVIDLRQAVENYEERLDQGAEGAQLLSVVAIYSEQSRAQADIVDAYTKQYKSAYRVLAASGKLLSYFGIQDPDGFADTISFGE